MDRRTSLKWMLAAASIGPLGVVRGAPVEARRYGSDPNLLAPDHPGELWPLTLTPAQRKLATVLSDIIIPADATSPSASAVASSISSTNGSAHRIRRSSMTVNSC